jgi:hypothetical protein
MLVMSQAVKFMLEKSRIVRLNGGSVYSDNPPLHIDSGYMELMIKDPRNFKLEVVGKKDIVQTVEKGVIKISVEEPPR